MPSIEITNTMYFIESIITIAIMFLCAFLGLFIGKDWYKSVGQVLKELFKMGNKK